LVFSIYAIGKYFLNPWVGVGAAALTLLFPISFGLSRTALIDFPLMAMVTLVQYLLLKSRGGTAIKWSWLLGLAMGFCFLTKWTGPVFFVGTSLFVFIASWKSPKPSKKSMFLALAICLAVGLFIALPWLIRSFPELVQMNRYFNEVDVVRRGLPKSFALQSFILYWHVITRGLISNILLPFIVIGIVGFFLWAKKWKLLGYLGCWILPAYIFFVGLPNKDNRFILPILPAIALLTAAGLSALPWQFIRKAVWLALLLAGLLQFFMTSFGWPKKMEQDYARLPLKEDWSINAILDDLEKRFDRNPIVVGFLPNRPYFNAGTLNFYTNLRELPYDIRGLGDTPITPDLVTVCDVFILKTAKLAVPWVALYRDQFFKEFKEKGPRPFGFGWGRDFSLPDKTKAYIFINLKHLPPAKGT
jgi:4-amino-4-deoxy-L-arabinose transferase-like glycosyltransferase